MNNELKVLDLFSGIGGFSLGLERTGGFKTVAFCEIDPFCRKVLNKHWPDVPIYEDVKNVTADRVYQDSVTGIDIITGGFPCQDLSGAGKKAGINAERSGLWFEMCRIIGDIRPRYAIMENVSALLTGDRGGWFRLFLNSLSEIGYDTEWETICASQIGAPHHRERVWIIAYPSEIGWGNGLLDNFKYEIPSYQEWDVSQNKQSGFRWQHWLTKVYKASNGFISKSDFFGVDDGISKDSHRIAALGNAVVPQIPEIIGRAILEAEKRE